MLGEKVALPSVQEKKGSQAMTRRIKAINAMRPKIELGLTVQMDELVEFMAIRTGLNTGTIMYVLLEAHDAIAFFGRHGRGVKLDGVGTYLPNIRLDGSFDVEHRQDAKLKQKLNRKSFTGTIHNRKNIGKSGDELVALWNELHPDDPVGCGWGRG